MEIRDFYNELKWCADCNDYVRYMMSVNHSYCTACGNRVRLFSKEDSKRFSEQVQKRKWKAS
ncbi:MAG: hypothetical protein KDB80_12380 [Planctomycetes bacterium]|nr:hypothetical protein [Planctomycetota bacterium]